MEKLASTKYEQLLHTVRRNIVRGVYPPGGRLPTRSQFGQEYDLGVATVQRALETLAADGFLRTDSRRTGTFVADRPPHLYTFGLILPAAFRWSRYVAALQQAAHRIAPAEDVVFEEYFISDRVEARGDMDRLNGDVLQGRVGGLIFILPPSTLREAPAVTEPDLPRVLVQPRREFGIPSIFLDYESFLARAVQFLHASGRRRIAHLRLVERHRDLESFEARLKRSRVEMRPYWTLSMHADSLRETAVNVVQLLMQLEGAKRPNALIIHDDNLVEHAVAGLMAAGVRIPQDLEVVAHFNYPCPVPSALPLRWLGFDCRTLLGRCLRVLRMQREGRRPPAMTGLPAIFRNELEADSPPE